MPGDRNDVEERPDRNDEPKDGEDGSDAKADDSLSHRPGASRTRRTFPLPFPSVSLRSTPIEHELTLPDGRKAQVRVGLAQDGYIRAREQETVVLELRIGRFVEASLNTVLDPSQEDAATDLAREVVAGLEAGRITPTAAALEQYADRLR